MSTINQLSTTTTLSGGDQVPVYSSENGDARKASLTLMKEFMQEDFVPAGGVMGISGFYNMRKVPVTPLAIPIGTTFQSFTDYDSPAFAFPADRTSVASMLTLGEFVMLRDVAAIQFWVALSGAWPTTRDLTLSILLGPDATPYESVTKFIGAGRGSNLLSCTFGSPAINFNNPGGTIKSGEKVKLVAKMDVADTLTLTRVVFVIQTLDGI